MHRSLYRAFTVMSIALALAGCGTPDAPPPTPTALPTALPTPTRVPPTPTQPATPTPLVLPTPTALPTAALPPPATVPPTATTPDFELVPRSKPADAGQTYPFTATLLCGVNYFVDFDGSLWEPAMPAVPRVATPSSAIDPVEITGTMTLLDHNRALFQHSGGSMLFHRLPGPKVVRGFCGE